MSVCIVARSISRPVQERLERGPFAARVLAVFERACDLATSEGDVVALVTSQVGDGPLNVVVAGGAGSFAAVEPGGRAWLDGGRLRVGRLGVALAGAAVWEPRPDWDALRARRAAVAARLPLLRAVALRRAPVGSLLPLTCRWIGELKPGERSASVEVEPVFGALATVAQESAEALRAGWARGPARLGEGAARLAGLGGGLTPAGDDFLAGAMLQAWLAHPTPRALCRVLVEAAAPRTTTLSAAFLRAAAGGQCSAPWHRLFAALAAEAEGELAAAVRDVLARGATSGADALAGFLWAWVPFLGGMVRYLKESG